MRILHVVESFGGGVTSALMSYVSSTPELEHHVLLRVREGDYKPGGELEAFKSVNTLPESHTKSIGVVRRVVSQVKPDIVHAHSSFAGAYVRLAVWNKKRQRIVYTPHCYAFERRDLNAPKRFVFRAVEHLLALNTYSIAACSRREASVLGKILAPKTVYVPNFAGDLERIVVASQSDSSGFPIVGSGRMAPQRDPFFFARIADVVHSRDTSVALGWIGGGQGTYQEALEKSGVKTTGWLSLPEALQTLKSSQVYIHTAAWDGFPMSVLESVALGVPTLVRKSPAFFDAPAELVFSDEVALANAALDLVLDSKTGERNLVEANLALWRDYLKENNQQVQAIRLREVYGLI